MFSQQLAPIFHKAADILHEEFDVSVFASQNYKAACPFGEKLVTINLTLPNSSLIKAQRKLFLKFKTGMI